MDTATLHNTAPDTHVDTVAEGPLLADLADLADLIWEGGLAG